MFAFMDEICLSSLKFLQHALCGIFVYALQNVEIKI